MISKNNRVNSNFQIAYFLTGSCFTADGAYSLLCDLKEGREMALNEVEANACQKKSDILRIESIINDKNSKEWEILKAKAELLRIEANEDLNTKNLIAAQKEIEFINKCIEKIQPLRKFSHLPDDESHQAIQQEEWKFELLNRAENYMLTSGTIPTDHFSAMRQHPEFKSYIAPQIAQMKTAMEQQTLGVLTLPNTNNFELEKLLPNYQLISK